MIDLFEPEMKNQTHFDASEERKEMIAFLKGLIVDYLLMKDVPVNALKYLIPSQFHNCGILAISASNPQLSYQKHQNTNLRATG